MDEKSVTFQWKDYRLKGQQRYKTMTLSADEFIRRFLLHVLPSGFHRIRHYGMVSNAQRKDFLPRVCELLNGVAQQDTQETSQTNEPDELVTYRCPCCGSPMRIIETFLGGQLPRAPPLLLTGT